MQELHLSHPHTHTHTHTHTQTNKLTNTHTHTHIHTQQVRICTASFLIPHRAPGLPGRSRVLEVTSPELALAIAVTYVAASFVLGPREIIASLSTHCPVAVSVLLEQQYSSNIISPLFVRSVVRFPSLNWVCSADGCLSVGR
jgi:hypothetical protein